MPPRDEALELTPAHRRLLETWIRAGTTPQRVVRRARIVLLAADGLSARAVARRLGISPHTVALWRRHYRQHGPSALLRDAPGRGRKPIVAQVARVRIRALIATPPAGGGRWTIRRIAEAASMGMKRAYVAERSVPKRGVREIEVIGVRTIADLFARLFG
jgi:transposase